MRAVPRIEEQTGQKIASFHGGYQSLPPGVMIDAVQNDPQTLERMAREQLGFARPDETIIRFEVPARHTVP